MRVVLVVPNFRWAEGADPNTLWHYIPYNLCLLAAMVRDICDVQIIDANQENMSVARFSQTICDINPDVVGITVLMDEYAEAGHICAHLAKAVDWDITTVMGGVYATTNSIRVMEDDNIDYAVVGEGEYIFRDLIGYLMGKKTRPANGICYREDGLIHNIEHVRFIHDLDELPFPAYDLIDFSKYSNSAARKSVDAPRAYPYARVITSRGCPFNCIFCQVGQISGKRFRGRSAGNVLDEIQTLKYKYRIRSIIFDDDNLLFDRARALEIFQGMIKRGLAMPWVMIATAVFELDEELLRVMRASGCEYIDVAIETGTERILRQVIDKPLDFDYAKRMVCLARDLGIYVTANVIVGFPTETWEEIRQTLKFVETIDADYVKVFSAIPLRNTRLWDLCVKEGAFKKGFDADKVKWSTGQIETDEFSADELTILRAFEWDRINFADPQKLQRTCAMMGVTEQEMHATRKATLLNALQLIIGVIVKRGNDGISPKIRDHAGCRTTTAQANA